MILVIVMGNQLYAGHDKFPTMTAGWIIGLLAVSSSSRKHHMTSAMSRCGKTTRDDGARSECVMEVKPAISFGEISADKMLSFK